MPALFTAALSQRIGREQVEPPLISRVAMCRPRLLHRLGISNQPLRLLDQLGLLPKQPVTSPIWLATLFCQLGIARPRSDALKFQRVRCGSHVYRRCTPA